MIQNVLVILSVAGAATYLVWKMYDIHIASKKKCDGCAIHKIYQAKTEQGR